MSDTVPLLDLVTAAIREARRGMASEELTVVPVVVTDRLEVDSPDRLLVEAVARHNNAIVLDASLGVPEGLEASPSVRAAARASLRIRIGAQLAPLELDVSNGSLVLTDELRSAISSESGVRELIGLGTSLLDRRLIGRDTAIMTYRETVLDDAGTEGAWSFVTTQLPGLVLPTLRSLVVIVQASRISLGRHCAPGPTLRFGIRDNVFVSRHGWPSDQTKARASMVGDGLTVLFLGAGFSASAGLPLGDSLRDETLREFFNADRPVAVLAAEFHEHLETNGQLREGEHDRDAFLSTLTLERVIEEQLRLHGTSGAFAAIADKSAAALARDPTVSTGRLAGLLQSGRRLVVVTVNFDQLVEGLTDVRKFVTREEFAQFPSYLGEYLLGNGSPPLLKLHGTIELPDTVIATISQVAGGLATEARSALLALAAENPTIIYVGYSMRDTDVTAVLGAEEFQGDVREWWVAPLPVLTARKFVANHRGGPVDFMARCITQTADGFFGLI